MIAELAATAEPRLTRVLARAFHDDPVYGWLFRDPDTRAARLESFFAPMLTLAQSGRGQVWTTREREGAAIWMAPGCWKLRPIDLVRMAPPMLRAFGTSVTRGLRMMSAMEHEHPTEPHHYLFIIGTDPGQQGRGVGAALMQPVLARCDADAMPAYLESSNPRNVSFYRRHGFEELGEIRVADAPPITRMRRPAR